MPRIEDTPAKATVAVRRADGTVEYHRWKVVMVDGTIVLCEGEVRWVPLSSMQAHRRKLQQRYSITTFKDGEMEASVNEWRDVPDGDY